jgi:hypothetical protein
MSDKPEHRVISAKTLAIFLLSQSGTPIIYQGRASLLFSIHLTYMCLGLTTLFLRCY